MDIDYLLFLQHIRELTNGAFDEFFNMISKISVDILSILPYLIFWAVDRSWGYHFLSVLWGGDLINGTIKLTVCAYRPWIRDARIEPAGDSKVAATGYSFPSGHTVRATGMYGTTALWQRKKRLWLTIGCCIMIVLTGFSRNFLGVHTPQDVFVGFGETVIIIFAAGFILKKIRENKGLADKLTVCGVLLAIAALVYVQVKSYPMDYVGGELLVDPENMKKDIFTAAGGFLGLMAGSFIERHYIKYRIPKAAVSLPVLVCVGTSLIFIWEEYLKNFTFRVWFGMNWGSFISSFLMVVLALTVYPLFIMKIAKKEEAVSTKV